MKIGMEKKCESVRKEVMMKRKKLLSMLFLCVVVFFNACSKQSEAGDNTIPYTSGEVVLGEYKGVSFQDTSEEVTEEEIQKAITEKVLASKAEEKVITDRPIQTGDIANIDYEGFVDGVAFENGKGEKYDLTIGSNSFIPGFEDGLIGANTGEEVEVKVTFPDPYKTPDLSGKDAIFKVKVNAIKQKIYPELTDELVAEATEYKTVDEYKEIVKQDLETEKKESADSAKRSEVMMKVIENATFQNDLTKDIEAYMEVEKQYWENMAQSYAQVDAKTYFANALGYSEEQYEEYIKTISTNTVKQQKVLNAIVEKEALTLTEEEFNEGVEFYMKQNNYEEKEEFLTKIGGEEKLRSVLLLNKAQELIVDSAVAE